jgi:hypothetical protein
MKKKAGTDMKKCLRGFKAYVLRVRPVCDLRIVSGFRKKMLIAHNTSGRQERLGGGIAA